MEQLNPRYLEEILEVLRDQQVVRFSCALFSVDLTPIVEAPAIADSDIARARERRAIAAEKPRVRGNAGHPSLWPNGEPPSFPRKEVVNSSPYEGDDE